MQMSKITVTDILIKSVFKFDFSINVSKFMRIGNYCEMMGKCFLNINLLNILFYSL